MAEKPHPLIRSELIAEAFKVSKNTRAKIRRYTRLGIKLNDNVTVEFNRIRRYNERQLRAYIQRVTTFNKTQYVRGHDGKAINKNKFNALKTTERIANQRARKGFEQFKDIIHPGSDMTFEQFRAMGKQVPRPEQRVTYDPFTEVHRSSFGITSEKALEELVKQNLRRARPQDITRRIESQRTAAKKVFEYLGMDDIANRFDELDEKQFGLLWRTDIVNKTFLRYETASGKGALSEDASMELRAEMDDYISWASQH